MKDTLKTRALQAGIELDEAQLSAFETYARLLVSWNEKMNLTAITDPKEIAVKHFMDSLAGARVIEKLLQKGPAPSLIDVGTGAGFPGIPLKIVFPSLELTLLDALQKRLAFLEAVTKELGLDKVKLVHERAEEGARKEELREQFDLAAARAVAPLPILMEYCSGFVKVGGQFLAYKGPTLEEELKASARAMKLLKLKHQETIAAAGTEEMDHYVAVFVKRDALPLQYPRKQSKIKNTPL